ncbi:DUF4388 domain-containing protein [bacterium]|nr:DUF4388 domain-containing protein [bacterium]
MSLRGSLEDVNLTDTIQILEMAGKAGCLEIINNNQTGRIYFKSGKVVHATLKNLIGQEVIFEMLLWEKGEFEFKINEQSSQETIKTSIQKLFMEGIKRIDEKRVKEKEKVLPIREKMERILKQLVSDDNQILGAIIVDFEGEIIFRILSGKLKDDTVLSVPELFFNFYRDYKKIKRPTIVQMFVNDEKGFVSFCKINSRLFLVSLSTPMARLGSLIFSLNKVVEEIAKQSK